MPTYKEFKSIDLILTEYIRRLAALDERPDMERSGKSVFYCISQWEELDTKSNVLKIETWDAKNDSDVGIGDRFGCGLVVLKNKAYVMGGETSSNKYLKTVRSSFELFTIQHERHLVLMDRQYNIGLIIRSENWCRGNSARNALRSVIFRVNCTRKIHLCVRRA